MNLFKDFQPISSKQWKQKIQMDLKGADYNETLIEQTNDGIKIKPFYHQDNYQSLEISELNTDFNICQSVFIADEKIASKIAKNALKQGANSIYFIADKEFDIAQILNRLSKFKEAELIFKLNFLNSKFNESITKIKTDLNLKFELSIVDNFSETGNWFKNKEVDFSQIKSIKNSNFIIGVNASLYQNSGANKVQQIAYTLAHINEYLNADLFKNKDTINCTFSVGGDYFSEIAKLRAFRYLFYKLISEYQLDITLNLIVKPSLRNKTIYDYNLNMLRTTTECMSAILGGANIITNVSYDTVYHKSNDFGERISRNQLIILQEESYFNNASSIVKGTYYIEQITFELAEKSLILFKDIEKNNGFIAQLKKGTIQRKIEESANKEQNQFDNNENILVGTNKYINANDKMKDDLQLFPFAKQKPRKTSIKPIIAKRMAEKIEQYRLKSEKIN